MIGEESYETLSRTRVKELKRAQAENLDYLDEIESVYGEKTYKQLENLLRTSRGYFIWNFMDSHEVINFYCADKECRGLIVDEEGVLLDEFIDNLCTEDTNEKAVEALSAEIAKKAEEDNDIPF